MRAIWRAVMSLVAAITVAGSVVVGHARQATASAVASPEQPEKLKELVEQILQTMIAGDSEKLSPTLEGMTIPDHAIWFSKTFGEQEGARLEVEYARLLQRPEEQWANFRSAAKAGKSGASIRLLGAPQAKTSPLDSVILAAMAEPTAIYAVTATGPAGSDSYHIGRFVFVGGGFRYLDDGVVQSLSKAQAPRVRMGGNFMAHMLERKVSAVYPKQARDMRLSGTVRLHVIVAVDGTVKDLELVSGHPVLRDAAIDAVRQWKYRPVLLNGKPVEVDTTVDVVFEVRQ